MLTLHTYSPDQGAPASDFAAARLPSESIATIYGMNLRHPPELDWTWGYPYGLALIAISAVLPLLWFKWRGWL
jgi:Mg2+ and Co2+ transporter CorA